VVVLFRQEFEAHGRGLRFGKNAHGARVVGGLAVAELEAAVSPRWENCERDWRPTRAVEIPRQIFERALVKSSRTGSVTLPRTGTGTRVIQMSSLFIE
jgi:hypothetical protein